jgi:hypothetical protein
MERSVVYDNDTVWQSHAKNYRVMNSTACRAVATTLRSFGSLSRGQREANHNDDAASFQDSWKPSFNTLRQKMTFKNSEMDPSLLIGRAKGKGREYGPWREYLPYDEYRAVAKRAEAAGKENGTPYSSLEDIHAIVEQEYVIHKELFLLLGANNLEPLATPPTTASTSQVGAVETVDEEIFAQDAVTYPSAGNNQITHIV